MRVLVIAMAVSMVSLAAEAKPHKRARHAKAAPPAATKVVPNDRAAQEHAKAEAELADLRAGRVSTESQADEVKPNQPKVEWAVQENDREVPANLKQKK